MVKETVNLARELDKIDLQHKKVKSESGWIEKAAEEMDIIVEDEYVLFFRFSFVKLNLKTFSVC